MEEKRPVNKSVLAVSLSLILVVVLLMAMFVLARPDQEQEGIVLPTASSEAAQETETEEAGTEAEFVRITTGNVTEALGSLQRPAHYTQSFAVTVGYGETQAHRSVELWVSGGLIHGEVRDDRKVRSVLTDGETAWIWYDTDLQTLSVTLDGSVTAEDLLGLPGFDYLPALEELAVLEADYLVLDDPATQCIFVSARNGADETDRWWINLANGLLYRADAQSGSQLVYQVSQTGFAALAEGDERFAGRFVLPDGTDPFSGQ